MHACSCRKLSLMGDIRRRVSFALCAESCWLIMIEVGTHSALTHKYELGHSSKTEARRDVLPKFNCNGASNTRAMIWPSFTGLASISLLGSSFESTDTWLPRVFEVQSYTGSADMCQRQPLSGSVSRPEGRMTGHCRSRATVRTFPINL